MIPPWLWFVAGMYAGSFLHCVIRAAVESRADRMTIKPRSWIKNDGERGATGS